MSKRLGGIIGCKYKTSSWHLNGFAYGRYIDWVNSITSGRSPPLYCTLTLIAMQGHQKNSEKNKTKQNKTKTSNMVVIIHCYIGCEDEVTTLKREQRGLFGVLGSRCLTGSALLDCHVLKRFSIYMIGMLDSLSDVWKGSTGTHHVISSLI